MLSEFKKVIAIFGLVAFLVSCLVTVSFADDDRDSYEKKRRIEKYEKKREKRHDRDDDDDNDRDDDDDNDRDDDDDNGTVEPPVIEPPVIEPPVIEPPVIEPPVIEPPVIEPPVIDGARVYSQNCSGCHGQGKFGDNVPSDHFGSRVNLTPAEIAAINAL